jgi:hypothetical protein
MGNFLMFSMNTYMKTLLCAQRHNVFLRQEGAEVMPQVDQHVPVAGDCTCWKALSTTALRKLGAWITLLVEDRSMSLFLTMRLPFCRVSGMGYNICWTSGAHRGKNVPGGDMARGIPWNKPVMRELDRSESCHNWGWGCGMGEGDSPCRRAVRLRFVFTSVYPITNKVSSISDLPSSIFSA